MPEPKELYEAVLGGDAPGAVEATTKALDAGADPQALVQGCMVPAMDEVGRRFEEGEFFVPELLIAARAMKGALELIRPILAERGDQPVGRVVIGTVKGDLHDIGKNLVSYMLEGGGFEVKDLGVDVSAETFVEAVKEMKADMLGLSALLTTTMPSMKSVLVALEEAGVRDQVKVLVGGAPVTQQFASEIGADAYAETAVAAVAQARDLSAV